MKKIYSVWMVMAMMLVMVSCNKKEDVAPAKFDIRISEITGTTAEVAVKAADPEIYFYFDILMKEQLEEGITAEMIASEMKEQVEAEKRSYPHYLSKGSDRWIYRDLFPEKEYTVYAMQLDSLYRPVGSWELKTFTTGAFEVKGTLDAKLGGEVFMDPEEEDLVLLYVDLDERQNTYLSFAFVSSEVAGHYTLADIDEVYGAYFVEDERNNIYYAILSLDIEVKLAADGAHYEVKGEAIAGNGIRYLIDIVSPVYEGNEAPMLKNIKFSKKLTRNC